MLAPKLLKLPGKQRLIDRPINAATSSEPHDT